MVTILNNADNEDCNSDPECWLQQYHIEKWLLNDATQTKSEPWTAYDPWLMCWKESRGQVSPSNATEWSGLRTMSGG